MTNRDCLWHTPPQNLTLGHQDVHVWRAALDTPIEYVQQLVKILSADERQRADRFYFDRDRQRFIIGRGLLRTILGHYLSLEPSRVQFCYEPRGKPLLAEVDNKNKIRFNLSHSQGLAVYAIACDREIGIDLEQIRPFPNAQDIAKRFFSVRESTEISRLPLEQ
ncbi:MAG TPA: 4'-phosphopantetheinyl transferase, partial [Cyanophyceae cyanobacterium]